MVVAKDILTKTYVKVKPGDSISSMIGKMRRARSHQALVFENNKYLGMIDRRFLLTSRVNPAQMKVGNIIKKRSKAKTPFYVPTLSPDADETQMCKLMNSANVHALPVQKDGKILGIVRGLDLADAVSSAYPKVPCSELGSMDITTAQYTDEIGKALNMMNKHSIEHLPVVDKRGKLVGLVAAGNFIEDFTLWDAFIGIRIPQHASHQGEKKRGYDVGEQIHTLRIPVEQIMTPLVCTITPSSTIREAVLCMQDSDVSSIVLTRNEKPVGILTLKDIFKDYAR